MRQEQSGVKSSLWTPVRVDVSTRGQRDPEAGSRQEVPRLVGARSHAAFPDNPGSADLCPGRHLPHVSDYGGFFLFLKNISFNWGIIALQSCVGFRRTSAWISSEYRRPSSLEPPSHPRPNPSPAPGHHRRWAGLQRFTAASLRLCVSHVVREPCYSVTLSTHHRPLLPLPRPPGPFSVLHLSTPALEKRLICTIF